MLKLAWPVIAALLLMITVPYVFAGGVIPIFGKCNKIYICFCSFNLIQIQV